MRGPGGNWPVRHDTPEASQPVVGTHRRSYPALLLEGPPLLPLRRRRAAPALPHQSLFAHIKRLWGQYRAIRHLGVVWQHPPRWPTSPPNPVLWWMGWQWGLTFISGPSFVSWRNCELTWDKRRASLQSDGPSCCISILSTLRFCDVVLHAASGRLYNRDAQSFATLLIQISISHILLSYTLVKFLGVVGGFFGNIAQQFIVKQWKQEKKNIPILTSQSARMKRASIMITELHKRPYETTGDNSLKWY